MKQIENEIKIIAREEFKEELEEIEKENNKLKLENGTLKNENGTLKNENGEYKKGIKQLKEMEDLSPEAKNIINSLIML
jgi:regulator of replication initiation timing